MPQKLILPINKCRVTASYQTAAYKARFGFSHYGADMICFSGQNTVFALGNGTVVAAGLDNYLGNVVVIHYKEVLNHKTGAVQDVIARCYHLASIQTKAGAEVNSDTRIGLYGNTGKYSTGAHLHLEFDSNVAAPLTSKTGTRGSNLITAAVSDTSVDPFALLHCKATPPDNQQITVDTSVFRGNYYALPECANIPKR